MGAGEGRGGSQEVQRVQCVCGLSAGLSLFITRTERPRRGGPNRRRGGPPIHLTQTTEHGAAETAPVTVAIQL